MLDAGFSVQLTDRLRRLFAEFFLNMALGRGRHCAEIVIESSSGARAGADLDGFTYGWRSWSSAATACRPRNSA